MTIRFVALLGCLAAMSARSFEFDFGRDRPSFSWWSENRQANLMHLDYAANPAKGKQSLRAGWDEAFTTYMHVYSAAVPDLSAAPAWRFRVRLTTTGPVGVRQCSLRLQDKNLETFYFDRAVRWDRAGEWTLDFVVDSTAPAFTRTTMHGKDSNKQLDLPLSTFGITFTFEPGSGEGEAFVDAISCEPVEPGAMNAGGQTVTAELADSFLQADRRPLLLPLDNGTQVELAPEGIQITPETGSRSAGVRFCLAGWSPNGVLAPQFPEYEKAELTATVTATGCDIDEVALRVVDLDGNNHRLPFPVKWQTTDNGGRQHKTTMELPTALPSPKPGDNRQFPLFCLQGMEFRSAKGLTGTIRLEDLSLRVTMPVLNALAMELVTDSEPMILRPDGNGQAKAILRNTLSVPVAVEAVLHLTDYNDEPEAEGWSLRQTLSFQPGEAKTVVLPRPQRLGVCYVNADLSIPGETTVSRRLQRTFAYMVPTGTQRPLAPQDFLFGSVAHLNPYFGSRQELERMADAMAAIGLRVVRTDLRNSRDDYLEWYDQVVEIFRSRGIEFDMILGYVLDRQGKVDYAASNERYGEWFRRYRGKIRFWEMLNEPDGAWGRKHPPMADDYVRLARETRELLTECDPDAGYMSAGFCRFDEPILGHFHADTMRQIPNLFDLHCFHGHGPFTHYAHAMIDGKLFPMRRELGVEIPWYANETALTSCGGTSEKEQAKAVFTKSLFSWARGSVGYTWYNMREKGKSPTNGEHNYGMLSFDLYPKPVYAAYNALTGLYSNKRFVRQLPLSAPFWGLVFQDDTEYDLALWSEDARSASLAFHTDARSAEVVDLLGNSESLEVTDGLVALTVGPDPRTVRLKGATILRKLPDPVQVIPPPMLLPGKACSLTVKTTNPLTTPQRASVALKTPAYITTGDARAEKTLAPNEQWSWETTLTLASDHRADYGTGEPMVVETSLGALPALRTREDVPVALAFAPGQDGTPLFVLDRRAQVVSLTVGDPLKEHLDWQGPDDLGARAWIDLAVGMFVLKVEVTDDKHCQPYSTPADCWKGDGLQVFVATDSMTVPCEFDFYLGDDGKPRTLYRRAAPGAGIQDLAGAEASLRLTASREGTTTYYLAEIPYAALGVRRGDLMRGFRFNFMVNENDGEGRDGWIRPAPGVGNGVDCRKHPLLLPAE